MRKRGFNMYLTKSKDCSIYAKYTPKFKNHQDAEVRVYIGRSISRNISQSLESHIMKITKDVVYGLSDQRR